MANDGSYAPKPDKAAVPRPKPQDDTIDAASDEAVRFMEQGDESGHAGRGDGG